MEQEKIPTKYGVISCNVMCSKLRTSLHSKPLYVRTGYHYSHNFPSLVLHSYQDESRRKVGKVSISATPCLTREKKTNFFCWTEGAEIIFWLASEEKCLESSIFLLSPTEITINKKRLLPPRIPNVRYEAQRKDDFASFLSNFPTSWPIRVLLFCAM